MEYELDKSQFLHFFNGMKNNITKSKRSASFVEDFLNMPEGSIHVLNNNIRQSRNVDHCKQLQSSDHDHLLIIHGIIDHRNLCKALDLAALQGIKLDRLYFMSIGSHIEEKNLKSLINQAGAHFVGQYNMSRDPAVNMYKYLIYIGKVGVIGILGGNLIWINFSIDAALIWAMMVGGVIGCAIGGAISFYNLYKYHPIESYIKNDYRISQKIYEWTQNKYPDFSITLPQVPKLQAPDKNPNSFILMNWHKNQFLHFLNGMSNNTTKSKKSANFVEDFFNMSEGSIHVLNNNTHQSPNFYHCKQLQSSGHNHLLMIHGMIGHRNLCKALDLAALQGFKLDRLYFMSIGSNIKEKELKSLINQAGAHFVGQYNMSRDHAVNMYKDAIYGCIAIFIGMFIGLYFVRFGDFDETFIGAMVGGGIGSVIGGAISIYNLYKYHPIESYIKNDYRISQKIYEWIQNKYPDFSITLPQFPKLQAPDKNPTP